MTWTLIIVICLYIIICTFLFSKIIYHVVLVGLLSLTFLMDPFPVYRYLLLYLYP